MTHRLLNRIAPAQPVYWPHRYNKSIELDTTDSEHIYSVCTETQRRKFLISMWARFTRKIGIDDEVGLWKGYAADSAWGGFLIDANGYLIYMNRASGTNGHVFAELNSHRLKFFDTGWYHFIFSLDPMNATSVDRLWWYCNGILMGREESNVINQGDQRYGVIGNNYYIGRYLHGTDHHMDGYIYDVRIIPGVCLQDGVLSKYDFGSWADKENGIWQSAPPNWTKYGGGADRVHLTFDDVNNPMQDQSGAGTIWNFSGTLATKTEAPWYMRGTWQHNERLDETYVSDRRYGMRRYATVTSGSSYFYGTVSYDPKLSSKGFGYHVLFYSVVTADTGIGIVNSRGQLAYWKADGSTVNLGGAVIGTGFTTDDEIGCIVDLENFRIKFYKGGVVQGTGWYDMDAHIVRDVAFTPFWGGGVGHRGFYRSGFSTFMPNDADFKTVKADYVGQQDAMLPIASERNIPFKLNASDIYHEVYYIGNGIDNHKISLPWDCSGADGNTMVWITQLNVVQQKSFHTNIMPGKRMTLSSRDAAIFASDVVAWTADGIELGENAIVNASGGQFVLQAFHMKPEYGMTIQLVDGTSVARNIAHGNNYIPKMVWAKNTEVNATPWVAYHFKANDGAPEDYYFTLDDLIIPGTDYNMWDRTQPDATNIRVGTSSWSNQLDKQMLIVTMAPVPGISEIDLWNSFAGTNNRMITLGFRPAFKLWKSRSLSTYTINTWGMVRNQINTVHEFGTVGQTDAPGAGSEFMAFLANGIKIIADYPGHEFMYWTIGQANVRDALGR